MRGSDNDLLVVVEFIQIVGIFFAVPKVFGNSLNTPQTLGGSSLMLFVTFAFVDSL